MSSCKKKKDKSNGSDFDRAGMLTNIGNNIVIPNYQKLSLAVNKLDSAIAAFNVAPDLTQLGNLQNIFKEAYRAWEPCSVFGFGPASTEFLSTNFNTFPIDSNRINNNISSGTYNLDAASNLAAQGFPGIDYLLFGTGTNNNVILARYTSSSDAANRKIYLAALCTSIKTKTTTVLNAWLPNGGNYIHTFVFATGTDVGSSTGQLVNQLNLDFETLKNYKVGLPVGIQSAGTLYPAQVEAYYCGISAELLLLQLTGLKNLYLGKGINNIDGLGFDDYLLQIGAKDSDGNSLNTTITNQFSTAIIKCQDLPDPLSNTITTQTTQVKAAYQELQKLLVLLKTDMPSALAVLITYADTDGD
ncbi:MAG TPA: imelysin family protein [Cytophagaceae bacterium]|nr:imelysin family protein [Cytophagaceae bacterium]